MFFVCVTSADNVKLGVIFGDDVVQVVWCWFTCTNTIGADYLS